MPSRSELNPSFRDRLKQGAKRTVNFLNSSQGARKTIANGLLEEALRYDGDSSSLVLQMAKERGTNSLFARDVISRGAQDGDIRAVADYVTFNNLTPRETADYIYTAASNRQRDIKETLILKRAEAPWYKPWTWLDKLDHAYLRRFRPEKAVEILRYRVDQERPDVTRKELVHEMRDVRKLVWKADYASFGIKVLENIFVSVPANIVGPAIRIVRLADQTLGQGWAFVKDRFLDPLLDNLPSVGFTVVRGLLKQWVKVMDFVKNKYAKLPGNNLLKVIISKFDTDIKINKYREPIRIYPNRKSQGNILSQVGASFINIIKGAQVEPLSDADTAKLAAISASRNPKPQLTRGETPPQANATFPRTPTPAAS